MRRQWRKGAGTCDPCRSDYVASERLYDRGLGRAVPSRGRGLGRPGRIAVCGSIHQPRQDHRPPQPTWCGVGGDRAARRGADGLDLRAGARAATLGARHRGARGGDRRLVDPDRHLDRRRRAPIPNQPRFVPIISVVVTQAATLPMVVAGVSLLLGAGGGLYWLVPGLAFSLVVAIVNAWVLLVEVVR